MKRILLICLIAGLAACAATPRQPAPDPVRLAADYVARRLPSQPEGWDRAALLQLALHDNPGLLEARAALARSAAAERSAGQRRNPTLELGGGYIAGGASAVALGIGSGGWLYSVAMDLLLPQRGERARRREAAALQTRIAETELAEAVWRLRMQLREAEAALADAQARLPVLERLREQCAQRLADESLRVEAGIAARTQLAEGQAALAAAQRQQAEALAAAVQARAVLAELLGYPAAAADGLVLRWPGWDNIAVLEAGPAPVWRAEALAQRPELQRSLREFDLADNALRTALSQRWGEWHLGPGFSWDEDSRQYTLAVSMSPPLLNRNEGPIAEAEAAREQAARHVLTVQAALIADIEQAERGWQAALRGWRDASVLLAQAQRQRERMAIRQREGLVGRPELRDAELAVIAQQLAVLDAGRLAQQARAVLEDAYRRPLDGPEQALHLLEDS